MSGHLDTRTAALELSESLAAQLEGRCDLLVVFGSFHHRAAFASAVDVVRAGLSPKRTLAVTAEAVLRDDDEREGLAGIAGMAMRLGPNARLTGWRVAPNGREASLTPDVLRRQLGVTDDCAGVMILADPFTTPISGLLPAIDACLPSSSHAPIFGGVASGASQPGLNVLVQDDHVVSGGAIGVTFSGPIDIDCIVSQGCRPIGQSVVVTRARDNAILELGGRKPMEVLQEMAESLSPRDRTALSRGMFAGFVINEYKPRFGRGDFLIRNVLAYDGKAGALTIAELPRIGQTIQFHVRDAETATEDLQLLLDAQQLNDPPAAGLLFTCNGRGRKLFDVPNHDVAIVRERLNDVPLAGFFAAGEIGPIGPRTFAHGHTAALALFRPKT